ncbi:flagellar export chaperone FliS [Pseudoduganella violaceinigra]|uniref:flagellar export chaperone FliS n=1 Tax=Pseudoduganella violaceinigra TaxID=246602 RepID=UPI000420C8C7|nr:flagellar export chaperone FliS [Pseudoduganella violaceinigra]
MFGSTPRGVNAYAKVGLETGVTSASPHKLIVMLYDGALAAIMTAITQMKAGNVQEKGKAISKAIRIIDDGLRASLDKEVGGEIALNLDALYDYLSRRLLEANLKNDADILEEVRGLVADLRDTWNQIGGAPAPAPNQPAAMASM